VGPQFTNILSVFADYFFALEMGIMISFIGNHMLTVFPYCVMDYYHFRFEADVSDYEDYCLL
jgi:hypothetical protein